MVGQLPVTAEGEQTISSRRGVVQVPLNNMFSHLLRLHTWSLSGGS
jgi:hypothetical protein